jgi:hypothetical protein
MFEPHKYIIWLIFMQITYRHLCGDSGCCSFYTDYYSSIIKSTLNFKLSNWLLFNELNAVKECEGCWHNIKNYEKKRIGVLHNWELFYFYIAIKFMLQILLKCYKREWYMKVAFYGDQNLVKY